MSATSAPDDRFGVVPRTRPADPTSTSNAHHCPHCLSTVAVTHPAHPVVLPAMRCTSCRLLIGAGRCKTAAEAAASTNVSSGTAAGMTASAARRADARPGDREAIIDELRTAGSAYGTKVERLRMTDYAKALQQGIVATELGVIIATFGTWKRARSAAAPRLPIDS